jgi:GNAT superfamily N-acetyltransferase
MRTDAARAFDFAEWCTAEQLAPHVSHAAAQRASLCVAPLDDGAVDAWLRSAVVENGAPVRLLHELIAQQRSRLHALGVRSIWAVDVRGSWLVHALREHGFRKVDEIVTYEIDDAVEIAALSASDRNCVAPTCAQHVRELAAIDALAFAPPWRYPEFVMQHAAKAAAVCAVWRETDRPVGYVLAHAQGEVAHVVRLAVDPQHGRRGIGSALLRHAIRQLRADGHARVTLNTIASLPAGRLYRRMGFRPLHVGIDVLRLSW